MSSLYLNETLESAETGSTVGLHGDEAKHAVAVARAKVGERVAIGNGRGLIARGSVTRLDPFEVLVDDVTAAPAASPELWLAQALAKSDRDELAVQASTELGVSGVIPWAAERSVTRWEGSKVEKGRARWQAIVREASKQSVRSWVPAVEPISSTAQLSMRSGLVLVLDPLATLSLTAVQIPNGVQITLVVGPEGGISDREFSVFEGSGAVRVKLGEAVLRTSTAGPAALAVLNARLGRW